MIWYAAYGTNLDLDRLTCYLAGGTPRGAALACPGARDPAPPRADVGLDLPGSVCFAWESPTWGGGVAFYDPDPDPAPAPAPAGQEAAAARAYLLTDEQFADVVAQEMHRPPGLDLAPDHLATLHRTGRVALGPGRYETLLVVGHLDGEPVVTFTSPEPAADHRSPAPAYLATMGRGLIGGLGWTLERTADYLATRRGAAPTWSAEAVRAVLAADS